MIDNLEQLNTITDPELRTRMLFSFNHVELAVLFRGLHLINPESGAMIRLTEVQPFSREDNSKGVYRPLLGKRPGEIFIATAQGHQITTISAMDNEELGACLKLHRARKAPFQGKASELSASQITETLSLVKGEEARLVFAGPRRIDRLYIIKNGMSTSSLSFEGDPKEPSVGEATDLIDRIVGR